MIKINSENLLEIDCQYAKIKNISNDDFNLWIITSCESDEEKSWKMVKDIRNSLLSETDWSNTIDGSKRLGVEKLTKYQNYRQKLSDIPQDYEFVKDIVWPILDV